MIENISFVNGTKNPADFRAQATNYFFKSAACIKSAGDVFRRNPFNLKHKKCRLFRLSVQFLQPKVYL